MTMLRAMVALAAVVVVSSHAVARAQGTAAERSAREKQMIAAEHKLVDAVATGDVAAFKTMVEADAWSISPRGAMAVADFIAGMKDLKIEPGWTITETRVVWAASNTAVLFYKLTGKATWMGQALPPVIYASTVWHESNKKWTASFHQETPAIAK